MTKKSFIHKLIIDIVSIGGVLLPCFIDSDFARSIQLFVLILEYTTAISAILLWLLANKKFKETYVRTEKSLLRDAYTLATNILSVIVILYVGQVVLAILFSLCCFIFYTERAGKQ